MDSRPETAKAGDTPAQKDREQQRQSEQADQPHRDITGRGRGGAEAGAKGTEAAQQRGDPSQPRDGAREAKAAPGDKGWESFERGRSVSPPDGVGFRFDDKNPAPGEVDRFLKGLTDEQRKALEDPNTKVTLYVSASRPGSEEHNQRLTDERGDALKRELEARGVKAEITVASLGEREARKDDQSPMSLKAPSDRDPEDRRDDPWDRTARIEIRPPAQERGLDPARFEGQDVRETLEQGEQVFKDKIEPLGEKVRELVPLRENPLLPDPSRDPKVFLDQLKEISKDTYDDVKKGGELGLAKALGGALAGSFFEIARDQWRKETEEKRDPLYQALAQGVAQGLDPAFKSNWQPETKEQQALFDAAKSAVSGLSEAQKTALGAYLTQYDTQWETSFEFLAPRMEGAYFRGGVERYFSSDKHFDYN